MVALSAYETCRRSFIQVCWLVIKWMRFCSWTGRFEGLKKKKKKVWLHFLLSFRFALLCGGVLLLTRPEVWNSNTFRCLNTQTQSAVWTSHHALLLPLDTVQRRKIKNCNRSVARRQNYESLQLSRTERSRRVKTILIPRRRCDRRCLHAYWYFLSEKNSLRESLKANLLLILRLIKFTSNE